MDTDSRKQAQERVDRIALFRRELTELERERALVLTPEQRSGLETHLTGVLAGLSRDFGTDASDSARRISWAMRLASLLGGAALLAAAVLFLHRIWGALGTGAQVLILAGIPLVLLVGAAWVASWRVDPFYPGLLGLAAGVAFVAELSALGSVLNTADSPQALLAWAMFALLVAYALQARLLLAGGLVVLAAYSAGLALMLQGRDWGSFMERTGLLIPAAAAFYAWPWLGLERQRPGFGWVYRITGAAVGLAALLVLSFSGDLCCSAFGLKPSRVVCQMVGVLLGAVVVAHGIRLGQGGLVNLGAAAFVIFLYARLHAWFWEWIPKYLFFLLIGVTALALLLVFRRLRSRLPEKGAL